jgi:hypothetical protein
MKEETEMIFTTALLIYTGVSFIGGSIIGLVIGNQVTRRNMRNQQAQEFEYWIGSFEDEGSSEFDVTNVTPFQTINTSRYSGFPIVPIRR